MSETETTPAREPTLRDILEWEERAAMQIATTRLSDSPQMRQALDAVHKLAFVARQALETPAAADLRWSIRNDPYCWAAYNHGRFAVTEPDADDRRAFKAAVQQRSRRVTDG